MALDTANGLLVIVPARTIKVNKMEFLNLADFEMLLNGYVLYKPTNSIIPNKSENTDYREYLKLVEKSQASVSANY